jgi:hypothetical protein
MTVPSEARRTRLRRLWLRAVVLAVGAAIAAQFVPLTMPTTVIPPASLSDPAPVFLVDFGRTPSLVLTISDDEMVAYVYGDWNYYALRNRDIFDGLGALLWPSQGTLGRQEIAGRPGVETVRRQIGSSVQEIHTFHVERRAIERLREALDRVYLNGLDMAVNAYGMTFVPHPRAYTYWWNSNHMTAAWMKALGCQIRGPAFSSRWRVRAAE